MKKLRVVNVGTYGRDLLGYRTLPGPKERRQCQ